MQQCCIFYAIDVILCFKLQQKIIRFKNNTMKKITMTLLGIATIGSSLLFPGCKADKNDSIKVHHPKIYVLEQSVESDTAVVCNEEVYNVLSLLSGDTLKLTMRFTGAYQLSQYKIEIHNNFDCHGHKGTAVPWEYQKIRNLNTTDTILTETFAVPKDVATGYYHLTIRTLDIAGTESETTEFTLSVNNASDLDSPTITMINPIEDSTTIFTGGLLNIQFDVSDNQFLEKGYYTIHWTDANGVKQQLDRKEFPIPTNHRTQVEFPYAIPLNAAKGWTRFDILVADATHNTSRKTFYVEVN